MIVACSIDRRFAELAGVMLYSFEKNGGIPDAQVFILGDGLRASDKEMLQACAKRSCASSMSKATFSQKSQA